MKFAEAMGVDITWETTIFKLPISDRTIKACGYANIECSFPSLPSIGENRVQKFHIFEVLAGDVILGLQFLRSTRTLDLHQHRLQAISRSTSLGNLVRSVENLSLRVEMFQCWLDRASCWAFPDTGANFNMISVVFASQLGYNAFNTQNSLDFKLADCETMKTLGAIEIIVQLFEPKLGDKIATTRKLVDDHGTKKAKTRPVHKNSSFADTFQVVAGLEYDVVLGERFLNTIDAYKAFAESFKDFDRTGKCMIAPTFRATSWEQGLVGGNNHNAQPAADQNSLDIQCHKEMDNHEMRLRKYRRRRQLTQEEAANFHAENQRHLKFYQDNRHLLSSTWLEWLVKKEQELQ